MSERPYREDKEISPSQAMLDRIYRLNGLDAHRVLAEIALILYPGGDPDAEHNADTLAEIACAFTSRKLSPERAS